jgi:epoxyqueuosine reductase
MPRLSNPAATQARLSVMNDRQLASAETAWLYERARALGFDECGVAPAEKFPELNHYSEWIERGYAGEMNYLKDPRRLNPQDPMPGARSVIVCALNYNAEQPYSTSAETSVDDARNPRGWISRYAWGDDYHEVLWKKLNELAAEMRAHFQEPFEWRAYADTGPIHERAAAKYAGLGWLAKNTLLINQSLGSWLFLGVILTSLPLAPTLGPADAPPPDRCGTCRRCLDACPTEAIVEPYLLDASRCISYLTIELRGDIPEEFREPMGRHVFGCDICQDVCPWNRKSPRTQWKEFQPRTFAAGSESELWFLHLPDLLKIASLSAQQFREIFRGSPIKRTKWQGLVRNACIALGNSSTTPDFAPHQEIVKVLQRLSQSDDAIIAESARWALSRIQKGGMLGSADRILSAVESHYGADV